MQVIQISIGNMICWTGQNYYIELTQLYAAYRKYTVYLTSDLKTDIVKYHIETNCCKAEVIILTLENDSFKANAISGEF